VSLFALAYGLLALANLPYVVMVTYLVAAWVVIRSVLRQALSGSLRIVAAGVLGAAVAGVYLLPMLAHLSEVVVPQSAGGSWWRQNFLFDSDAFMMPRLRRTLEDAAILPASGLVSSLAVLGILRRSSSGTDGGASSGPDGRETEVPVDPKHAVSSGVQLLAAFGVLSFFLATPLSTVLWANLPVLHEINMPWRFLEVLAIPAAVLTAVAVRALVALALEARSTRGEGDSAGRSRDLLMLLGAGGLVVVAILTGVAFASVTRMTPVLAPFRSGELSATALAQTFHARQSFFLPLTAANPMTLLDQRRVLPLTAGCRVTVDTWDQAERLFTVQGEGPCELAVRTYYFRGWRAEASTESGTSGGTSEVEVRPDPESGGLLVSVPAGESRIRVWFASGAPTVLGMMLSVAALIVCLGLGHAARQQAEHAPAGEPP
jgi:hypothetical protein